ncbi:MAG TPA: hypothetical protein VGM98_16790 [Schlesneria sp.]
MARRCSMVMLDLVSILLICAAVFSGGELLGADKVPKGAAIYEMFAESIRPQLARAYAEEVKRQEKLVATAKKELAQAKGSSSREAAIEARDEAVKALADLKETNDPPFVGCWLDDCHTPGATATPPRKWNQNWIGVTDDVVSVNTVSGPEEAIVYRKSAGQWLLVKGISTSDWSDGERKSLQGRQWWISGKKSYPTLGGGQQVVTVIEPFNLDSYLKSLEQESKSQQKAK